jgi:hypothetical protein
MASRLSKIRQKLEKNYRNLSDREQKLVMVFIIVMPLLLMALLTGVFYNSLEEIENQTDQYRQTLELIAGSAPTYINEQSGQTDTNRLKERFDSETLKNNDFKIKSFLAKHAQVTNVDIRQYTTDIQSLTSEDEADTIIEQKKVIASIRSTKYENLLNFLERIDTVSKPVVITKLEFRNDRRDPGKIRRIQVTVATFQQKQKES